MQKIQIRICGGQRYCSRTETYHVDDYIDNDLTNGDIFFLNATVSGKFDGTYCCG